MGVAAARRASEVSVTTSPAPSQFVHLAISPQHVLQVLEEVAAQAEKEHGLKAALAAMRKEWEAVRVRRLGMPGVRRCPPRRRLGLCL
jgi:hypothetical protein